jgi:Na+/melibiose symporter-like transporter
MSVPSDFPPGSSPGAASPSGALGGSPSHGPEQGEKERIDRELIELLNELRVALPGAQVLFAFLLAVPFQQRFHLASSFQRTAYFVTLSLSLVAAALLIAPSALHRLNFRIGDKRVVVMLSNKLVIAGIGTLALAMVGVMLLIADVLYGTTAGIVAAVGSAAIFGFLWMGLPLRERRAARGGRREGD